MALFRGKIYCINCNRKHKYKKRAKKPVYVCSTYDNYGSRACIRNQVDEEDLVWFVYGHFSLSEKDVTREFIDRNVIRVITNDEKTEIIYKNGEKSLITPTKLIR